MLKSFVFKKYLLIIFIQFTVIISYSFFSWINRFPCIFWVNSIFLIILNFKESNKTIIEPFDFFILNRFSNFQVYIQLMSTAKFVSWFFFWKRNKFHHLFFGHPFQSKNVLQGISKTICYNYYHLNDPSFSYFYSSQISFTY